MDTANWAGFPHDAKAFDYADGKLEQRWPELHAGDREPLPDADRISRIAGSLSLPDAPPERLASDLKEAWRKFHRGDFADAVRRGEELGLLAHALTNKAAGIYADYLEEDEKIKLGIYTDCSFHAEGAINALSDDPNAHYFHAFALGRYGQGISVAQALARGLGGRIRASLERALELEPEHAEAHTAMGLYHAEIIDKVGKLVGGMTYGANADKALEHFERALALTPDSPIAHIEYGNGLYLLFGDKRLDDSNAAYARAAEIQPIDAMQKLDVEYARASLE